MKFEVSSHLVGKISADGLVLFAFEEKDKKTYSLAYAMNSFPAHLRECIANALALEVFNGTSGETVTIHLLKNSLVSRVYVVGLGSLKEYTVNDLRKNVAQLVKRVNNKASSLLFTFPLNPNLKSDVHLDSYAIAEGVLLGSYQFIKYKKKEGDKKKLEVVIFSEANKNTALKIREGTKKAEVYARATVLARDLVNEPSAVVTPTYLAKIATELAKKNSSVRCTVYDKQQLEKMGMGAFLGIAQAADTPPKFIVLEYSPKDRSRKRKIALVGKGITFDSGGINVKTGDHMQTMKLDMAGAGAVLAVFSVLGDVRPACEVLGIIAATPNLISGKSIVPGDVVKAYNGKTIEILNTDAEGRVTLADSLSYAVKKGATEIVDLATLTGACMVALGLEHAGLFANNKQLKEDVLRAAAETGEKVWELPLPKEYKELNKSEVADIANIPSTRYAGAITGALFLQEFVDNKPWVHLDIAGPAFFEKPHDLGPKGATGFGVRMLLQYLRNQ